VRQFSSFEFTSQQYQRHDSRIVDQGLFPKRINEHCCCPMQRSVIFASIISYPFILITDITWPHTVPAPVLILMPISVWQHYKDAVGGVRIQPAAAFGSGVRQGAVMQVGAAI
jgi:hypothetical protein